MALSGGGSLEHSGDCRVAVVARGTGEPQDGGSKAMTQVESKSEPRKFTPEELAAVIKIMRTERGWSQEVLADLCRVDVRTIQRLESGEKVGEGSLRAIARAFGYQDIDFFNKAHAIPTQGDIEAAEQRFHEENLLLDAIVATTGRELASAFAETTMDASNPAVELAPSAAEDFARLVDYLRDFRDIAPDIGEVEKLTYYEDINGILMQLNAAGVDVCFSSRDVKLVGVHWKDKTPWAVKIMYLSAFTRGKTPGKMAVPKRVQL